MRSLISNLNVRNLTAQYTYDWILLKVNSIKIYFKIIVHLVKIEKYYSNM